MIREREANSEAVTFLLRVEMSSIFTLSVYQLFTDFIVSLHIVHRDYRTGWLFYPS